MILAIDIGNSNIVIGAYAEDGRPLHEPLASWRLTTVRDRTVDETRLLLRQLWQESHFTSADFSDAALSSVVAPLTDLWRNLLSDLLGKSPLLIRTDLDLPLELAVDHPDRVGTDRLVDGVAATQRLGYPCIAVDFGTATTFNVIDNQRRFIGGAIAPGLNTVAGALIERASALPGVEMTPPRHVIGANTVSAIQSGLIYGYVGLVEGLIRRIRSELGRHAPSIATGGLGHLITPLTPAIDVYDPWLTLQGIRDIYFQNRR